MSKRLNKRGFALQFTWIFVLIAGAVFLGFFISLIRNFDAEHIEKSIQESTQELDSLIKISSAVDNTEKIVTLGKTDKKIIFTCDETSEYKVEGSIKSARYDYNAVFSPNELKGRELTVKTLVFEAPFKIMPLVYVTDADIEYVFVSNAPIINAIYSAMPNGTTKKSIVSAEITTYSNNNYDHVVFILNASDSSLLANPLTQFKNKRDVVFAVVISLGAGNQMEFGEFTFYKYTGSTFVNEGTVPFFDTSNEKKLALGGIISHNKQIYECNLRKVLRRIELLAELHMKRLRVYQDYYAANQNLECNLYYSDASNYMETIKQNATEKTVLSVNDFKDLRLSIQALEQLNNMLVTSKDCAPIY